MDVRERLLEQAIDEEAEAFLVGEERQPNLFVFPREENFSIFGGLRSENMLIRGAVEGPLGI
jgi:hypothetical protein